MRPGGDTVKRYHYETHDQLRAHLGGFVSAYNIARRLKTLKGLTTYEYVYKIRTTEPERFKLDPTHQMPGLNIWWIESNIWSPRFLAAMIWSGSARQMKGLASVSLCSAMNRLMAVCKSMTE